MVTDDVSVQHNHLPRCNGQRGKQNKTLACPARQTMFSQCNSPLFKRVAAQVKVLAGQINLRGSFPARQVMFWNLCCTLDVYIGFTMALLVFHEYNSYIVLLLLLILSSLLLMFIVVVVVDAVVVY